MAGRRDEAWSRYQQDSEVIDVAHDQSILRSSWAYMENRYNQERVVELSDMVWRLFPEAKMMPFRDDWGTYEGRSIEELLAMFTTWDRLFLQVDAVDGVLPKETWSIGAYEHSFDMTSWSVKPYSRLNTNVARRKQYNDRLFEILRVFGSMSHCRELWCRHTAFVGDPYFLYRPPLMKMLDDFRVFKEAIQPVNAMLETLEAHVDREEILAVLRGHGIVIEPMADHKVFVKFCDMFEDWVKNPLIKSPREILKEIRTRVETRLSLQGIAIDWLNVKVPRLPKLE